MDKQRVLNTVVAWAMRLDGDWARATTAAANVLKMERATVARMVKQFRSKSTDEQMKALFGR
jgi:hypothetical protein